MANSENLGSTPTEETGAAEAAGNLNGDQLYQELLSREEARQEPVEEVEAPEETPEELPDEAPAEESDPQAEQVEESEDQPEEVEEAEPEEEDVLSQDEVEEPQRVPLKRLNKEVARRKDVEERLHKAQAREEALKQQLEVKSAEPPQQAQPTPADPMPEVDTPQALARLEEETQDAIDYIERKLIRPPDAIDDSGNEVYTVEGQEPYTRERLDEMLLNCKRRLRREIPQKKTFLSSKMQVEQQAPARHPWLRDNKTPEYQQFQAIMAPRPWLSRSDPQATALVALAVEGLKAMADRQKPKAKKPVAKKEVAPPIDTTSSVPRKAVTSESKTKRREAREKKILSKSKLESRDLQSVFLQRELDRG